MSSNLIHRKDISFHFPRLENFPKSNLVYKVLENSAKFWKILEYSGNYWKIMGNTGKLWKILEIFWINLKDSGKVWKVLENPAKFLELLENQDHFDTSITFLVRVCRIQARILMCKNTERGKISSEMTGKRTKP